ncbi:uncharacterized protein CC84DRAFT_1182934 [Paraphaeosphaeria sporulosa]|uniref:DUF1996 domain-containing protein n=1 Tax=Paraphaeosphaeria sporulosa TaxID=1460663 RepID=A0A177CY98_9PLEO|nr:uncharacterized protein CC84DRAFT_1182934 [Paraphaeosphaeria sporulosa]OAG12196.1 hypothetical protein CC84DRAFT_1182934 [Paraphaeosphaeria sporulosa]
MASLTSALALIAPVQAGLRFPCSTLTVQRLDPVVQPGSNPSAHVHHIVGGNAFNASMTGDVGARATCTTCQMAEDFSNYWTAQLYFKHPTNGSYKRVPVVPVQPLLGGSNGASGGLTVYYTQFDLSKDNLKQQKITAFQPGFRMTVGIPTETNKPHVGLRYQCLSGNNRGAEMPDFPTKPCSGGIFTTHHFPACWDGKNLDSPDHQSHMYNTIRSDGFTNAPACPSSHPIRVPQVTYETTWDTTQFNSLWKSGDPNPFVWSFEGTSGYGTHADYMFGWKGDALQRAMDKSECFYDGCGSIKKQAMTEANKCTVKDQVGEKVGETEWLEKLPGM